jgi:type VI secretion system protein ImpA
MLEIDALLAETDVEPPCGPSLEYDLSYQELERALQGKPEQVLGDHTIPATPPDWNNVLDLADTLLKRSKDLRVAVSLTRALVHLDNLHGLAAGLQLIEGLLARYWDSVHPLPEPEDEDQIIRVNTLSALADNDTLLTDLRGAILAQASTHGKITVRDAEVTIGRLSVAADVPNQAQIEAALQESVEKGQSPLGDVRDALQHAQEIGKRVAEKLGDQAAPDLKPLTSILKSLLTLDKRPEASETPVVQNEVGVTTEQEDNRASIQGLRNREDALRILDAVCDFLEKNEPTNPAPLLIRRAQRLMKLSFVDIIGDLLPDSLSQVKHIAGLDKE